MKLFLVIATDPDDDLNLDLFVRAETPEDTRPLWEKWVLDLIGDIPLVNYSVYEVPAAAGAAEAIDWPEPVLETKP